MKNESIQKAVVIATGVLFIGALTIDAHARGGRGGGGGGFSGGGGGGGFSRSGPAAGGSFAGRSAPRASTLPAGGRQSSFSDFSDRSASRQDLRSDRQGQFSDRQDDRQDFLDESREDRQDYRDDAREDWQDHHDDHWDNDWDYWGWGAGAAVVAGAFAVGTVLAADAYYSLGCTPTSVVVNGITYARCDTTWYQPSYTGGDVTYIVVNPPPGY